ncbi:MAG TPA: aspartate--tRNA(Asn) ligase [Acidimicrobiales bacterium]|nr:aspartate--tRNA(Asn) ligase [Acidimicrobiales bacterium]
MSTARTLLAELASHAGEHVRVCGWVDDVISEGDRWRVRVRDRSGWAVLVVDACPSDLQQEAAVEARGEVGLDPGWPGGVRVSCRELRVVGPVLDELPLDEGSSLQERLDWRFLDLRRPRNVLVFAVQTTAERAMRQYWAEHGFLELHSPKLRPNPNRSGRELFSVPYFDRQAYLVQSPQFYKQMAMAAGFERIFEIGPVFRAFPFITARHDTEFTSVDVEMSWIDSHHDLMAFEERWLRHVIATVAAEHGDDIARQFGTEVVVPSLPFPRVTLDEARAIAEKAGPALAQPPGDLDPHGERALGEHVAAAFGHEFVFVTEYPQSTRGFYHMHVEEDSAALRDFDLLWKGMEVTTGAQREHRYDRLIAQAEADGVPLDPIRYYLDCFRFGCPPHGGFGLGLTRMLMALLGQDDVREVTYLPRSRDRLSP